MALVSILIGKVLNKNRKGPEIGGFVIDVSLNETHTSTIELTENAVEKGVDVTDHANKKPDELQIHGLVSDTPITILSQVQGLATGAGAIVGKKIGGSLGAVAGGAAAGALVGLLKGKDNRVKNGYDHLRDLQSKRIPFVVITGLKRYKDMMLTSLTVTREPGTGRALDFTATFKEVRIVQSKIVKLPNTFGAVANSAAKKSDLGRQSANEASADNKTLAKSITDGLGVTGG